ncbi:exosortase/archaeosortase family protein [Phytoactinopolyspora limicola]|uniref:exosortase/archaeosortase family protein n=1 Tax=Phytoactinopolyspora limicola TaxID=2715536 RepID=UPI00140A6205|nr:exosortase/archaeosortase family protein [Phytoactinopolyspora limicola]
MSAATTPSPSPSPSPARRRRKDQPGPLMVAARRLIALMLLVLAVWAIVNEQAFRAGEAWAVSHILDGIFGVNSMAVAGEPLFVFQGRAGNELGWSGLRITMQCTVLLFLVPTLFVAAMALNGRRVPGRRILLATTAAVGLLVVANLARCVMIALAMNQWGRAGYEWTHVLVGSIVMLAAALVAVLVFVRLGFFGRRDRPGRRVQPA